MQRTTNLMLRADNIMILIIGKDREWFPRMIFWIAHTKRRKEWIWHLGYKRQLKPFCELTVRSIYRLLGCSQMSLSSSFFSPPFTLSFNLAIFWQIHFCSQDRCFWCTLTTHWIIHRLIKQSTKSRASK